jgi:hypothetical protein
VCFDAWKVLGWLGLGFFILSSLDIFLGWYPVRFGTPEWEFGTVSGTVSGLSIPTLGLYLLLGSALARDRVRVARTVAIAFTLLAIGLVIMVILYLTNVPLALKSVATNDLAKLSMKKAILRCMLLFLGYEALYIAGAMKGFRRRVGP